MLIALDSLLEPFEDLQIILALGEGCWLLRWHKRRRLLDGRRLRGEELWRGSLRLEGTT